MRLQTGAGQCLSKVVVLHRLPWQPPDSGYITGDQTHSTPARALTMLSERGVVLFLTEELFTGSVLRLTLLSCFSSLTAVFNPNAAFSFVADHHSCRRDVSHCISTAEVALRLDSCVKLLDIGRNWNMLSHISIQTILKHA